MTLQRVVGREVNSKATTPTTPSVPPTSGKRRLADSREGPPRRDPDLEEHRLLGAGTARSGPRAADALKAGTKFEQVVKDVSDGPRRTGGDLGWVARGELVPEIDRAVFALPVGTVSIPSRRSSGGTS